MASNSHLHTISVRQLLGAFLLVFAFNSAGTELAAKVQSPFRFYTVADGLNQKASQAVVQDSHGFLWIGTFGGLNRFDGAKFESFTTRHGLRQNFVTALLVDAQDRLWVGDAEGGITLIEQGEVTLTVDHLSNHPGTIRELIELDGYIYIGAEPGSLRRISSASPESGIEYLADIPGTVRSLAVSGDSELLLLSDDHLYSYRPGLDSQPQKLAGKFSGLSADKIAGVYVGNYEGSVGRWDNGEISWLAGRYKEPVFRITFDHNSPAWVHTESSAVPFGQPDAGVPINDQISSLIDSEGILWIATGAGLARYLGNDFRHYPLTMEGGSPSVFSIQPDAEDGYWFGTDLGLLHVNREGEQISLADTQKMPTSEVRSLKLTNDQQSLWVPHVDGQVYRVNTSTGEAEALFPADDMVVLSLELDEQDRVWAGTFEGALLRYDPVTRRTRTLDLGDGASIYSSSLDAQGWLWFSVNYSGIYRLNTRLAGAEPELVISVDEIKRTLFTHVVVTTESAGSGPLEPVVWFATINGGAFRWQDGTLDQLMDDPSLSDKTFFALAPLPDNTLVVSSNKGAYRYNLKTTEIKHYGALNGFAGIEGKAHSMYQEDHDTLWIGTASGVTAMDVSEPMEPATSPRAFITRLSIDEKSLPPSHTAISGVNGKKIVIEYTAVSTSKPGGLEFSYKLSGFDNDWSAATKNQSIGYSHLPPGSYEFLIRARQTGSDWGASDHWSFTIPTPFWKTYWFIFLEILAFLLVLRGIFILRLRSIEKANTRLREEVVARTKSIEAGRTQLEETNRQLSVEIDERKRSDALRADVEARFHQAYQNSPIGMALVDTDGIVYDANPSLKNLFWPEASAKHTEPLVRVVAPHDRERFEAFLGEFSANTLRSPSMQFECTSFSGDAKRIDFLPSAVRDDTGELKYIVLLANDITESHEMTRQLQYQASFDELTGLLNRRAYAEKLKTIGASSHDDAYLLMLDLDQFKVVNDTCGHAAGDELLRKTAQTIVLCVRELDTVARLGGDEFAVILAPCSQALALDRAEHIRQAIQELEFFWENEIFRIGVSIGVVSLGRSNQDTSELQRLADAACFAAKDAGRNRVHLVSNNKDAAHEHRGEMRWVQRLKHAVDTNGFVLFGQKIEALHSGDFEKLGTQPSPERIEVLIRMRDRQANRLIPPNAFLPAAERYGLNDKLDLWVVTQVIKLILSQNRADQRKRQFWVNLSGASLSDQQFSKKLRELVEASNVPKGSLNFEITETAVIRKIDDAARLVVSLRLMGCRFALDDFGSGLSSFGYLKKLKVDCLKIDGEFIRNITDDQTDQIFVKSIVDIAHSMGMEVVTEFVERKEVLGLVRALGADYAQGFGVHRPEPLEGLVDSVIPAAHAKG